ncbi:TPA: hypothetical protein MJB50_000828 [Klebsiella aerogenes]|nr:hypothetical protein [Klebsiella aerogenes]
MPTFAPSSTPYAMGAAWLSARTLSPTSARWIQRGVSRAAASAIEFVIIARHSKGWAVTDKFYALANPNNVIVLVEVLEKVQIIFHDLKAKGILGLKTCLKRKFKRKQKGFQKLSFYTILKLNVEKEIKMMPISIGIIAL